MSHAKTASIVAIPQPRTMVDRKIQMEGRDKKKTPGDLVTKIRNSEEIVN
jgi:hypothetical protein